VILAPVLAARIGPTDFAAVLPALVVGSLLVPLMTLLAARRLGASPAFAVGGATFSLLALLPQDLSGRVLADVPFTAILFAAWLSVWRHRPAPAWRWFWAGALLGVAYLLKPAALLHVPALLPTLWLGAAEREGELGRGDRVRAFAALCVGLALPTLPWMARNAAVYGDPLHSANKHIAVGEDYREDWQENGFRRVWWAHPGDEIPTLSKALGQYGAGRMAEVLLRRLRLSLAGREVWWLTLALLVGAGMLRRREGWSLAAYHLGRVTYCFCGLRQAPSCQRRSLGCAMTWPWTRGRGPLKPRGTSAWLPQYASASSPLGPARSISGRISSSTDLQAPQP
jgi:hypothetical protein